MLVRVWNFSIRISCNWCFLVQFRFDFCKKKKIWVYCVRFPLSLVAVVRIFAFGLSGFRSGFNRRLSQFVSFVLPCFDFSPSPCCSRFCVSIQPPLLLLPFRVLCFRFANFISVLVFLILVLLNVAPPRSLWMKLLCCFACVHLLFLFCCFHSFLIAVCFNSIPLPYCLIEYHNLLS